MTNPSRNWMFGAHLVSAALTSVFALVLALVAITSAKAQTYSILYSFKGGADGQVPQGNVVLDARGNLYGTTSIGGAYGCGTVFKLDKYGNLTVLHSFGETNEDGCDPAADLVLDSQDDVYGITTVGGTYGVGTVFTVTQAGGETVLYSFVGGILDGAAPVGGLAGDAQGRLLCLCGGTEYGGLYGQGVLYSVTAGGVDQVLHNFEPAKPDGELPVGGLIQDNQGTLIGTAALGGTVDNAKGEIYEFGTNGYTALYNFPGEGEDGAQPMGRLLLNAAGVLYGTTEFGGDLTCNPSRGCGTVFKLNKRGKERVLHTFTGTPGDGFGPLGDLARDHKGKLYGATASGGDPACNPPYGCGIVFMLDKNGNETILHTFTSTGGDGNFPYAGIVRGPDGTLYGTTANGGNAGCQPYGCGTVFMLKP